MKSVKKNQSNQQNLPLGLYNQGATCYLNSVLQLLFMTPDFQSRLNANLKTDQVLKTLFDDLKEKPCDTKDITKHFQIEDVRKQRDAAEYLEFILNQTGRSASEIFSGKLSYSTKCSQGHTINEETNGFWTLPLPLRGQNNGVFSVKRGFDGIFKKRIFSGETKVFCEDCGGYTEAKRGCEMRVVPQVLVLLLKRFVFDYDSGSHAKSMCEVEIPTFLQIKGKSFELFGLVNHEGTLRSGHYTATIWSDEDKTWYNFSDVSVQKTSLNTKETPAEHCRSDTAYLLAYRVEKDHSSTEVHDPADQDAPETRAPSNSASDQGPRRAPSNRCTSRQRTFAVIFVLVALSVLTLVLGLSLGLKGQPRDAQSGRAHSRAFGGPAGRLFSALKYYF